MPGRYKLQLNLYTYNVYIHDKNIIGNNYTVTNNKMRIKAHTHRTRFSHVARIFIFQKEIYRFTIENFGRYEKQMSLIIEML